MSRFPVMKCRLFYRTWRASLAVLFFCSARVWAGPLTPTEALEAFQTEPGLVVELVAAEPTVESPVALAFDEFGRLYLAENRGYPSGPGEGKPPLGRIILLEDCDGDGQFEKRTVFAEDLTFPNGVLPWDGGLIVTCAPDILYLKDTDQDGRADQRTVWLTGFSTSQSTQLRVSHPILGLDGWIYVTSGLVGGEVSCPSRPDLPAVKYGRNDLRFRPDLSAFETCDGGGQFGQCFDGFGHRFTCYNRVQAQHVVLSSRDLKRNPRLPFSETLQDCPLDVVPEPAKGHGASARLYPISANITTADSHAGTFTAACGVLVWRGQNLPASYSGGVFACDPTGNLVHFDKLEPRGATFGVRAGTSGREFLASTDDWFRPVFLAHGPDGALYVCDMYRKTIEHPDYLPVEIRKRTDFESGKGMGRVWRVRASDRRSPAVVPNRPMTANDLVRRLREDQGNELATVLRIILAAPRELQNQIVSRIDPGEVVSWPPENYIVWLRITDAVGQLTDQKLIAALRHSSVSVREQGLQLSAELKSPSRELIDAGIPLASDADPQVRFQWALWAGRSGEVVRADARIPPMLATIALRDPQDRWVRAGVLSSIVGLEQMFLSELLRIRTLEFSKQASDSVSNVVDLMTETGRVLGADPSGSNVAGYVASVLRLNAEQEDLATKAGLLSGISDSLRGRGLTRRGSPLLVLVDDPSVSAELRSTIIDRWGTLLQRAALICRDSTEAIDRRLLAIKLLAQSDSPDSAGALIGLIDYANSDQLQSQAIRALGAMTASTIPAELLSSERFTSYTPGLREDVLSVLFSNRLHQEGILTAIEAGNVPIASIDSLRRRQLMSHNDPAVKARAEQLFGLAGTGDRAKVYEAYKSCLDLPPQPNNGRAAFKRLCANCHRLDREGVAVGPDLFGIRNQPKEAILLHILIPEHEIAPNYTTYIVETKAGRVFTGLLTSNTSGSVTLKQALGKEETILRSEIDSLVASKLSLMPQEIEKQISRQEFADLIAYLKGEAQP